MMTARTGKGPTLKWMGLLTLFAVLPPIIAGLSIVQIYHEDLKGSFIALEGIVLIAGILFSFFLSRKLILPVEQLSKEIGETGKASWHPPIEPATDGGVKDLTESFNQMIEDLKQSQESLKETEEKYRRIFEKSKDMVFITSVDGKFINVNQAGMEILGYKSKEELMGMHVKDTYFNHEDRKKFMEEIGKEGFVKDFEVKLKRKDETPIDVLITANARKDDSGNLLGYEGIIKDISDRKRMEEELRKSEERYRTIIDNIQEAYYEIDLAGNFTFVNDTTCRDLGYTRDELIGMNNRQYEDETMAKKMFQLYSGVYRTGQPIKILDGEIIRKDGTKKTYEMSVSLIRNLEGKPVGFRGISWDVTERKRAEEALRQSEEEANRLSRENAVMAEIGRIVSSTLNIEEVYERFGEEVRKVIPFDRVSVSIVDPDCTFITVAYNFGVQIAGRQPGARIALYGPYYEDIVKRRSSILVQTEDESQLAERYPYLLNHFRIGIRSFVGTPLISKNQLIGVLHIQSLKPGAYTESDVRLAERVGNQIAGAIANAQLFSERKRAEEALRESETRLQVQINRMPIGCIVWDREFRVLSWNPAAERIFGFTAEEAFGKHPYNFIVPKAAQPPIDTIWRRLLDGDTTAHSLNENNTKDGRIIIFDWSNTPLKEGNGTVIGVLSMVQDITDRKRAEETLRQSEERYRTIIDNIQDGYLEVDLAGNFTFVNDAECVNLGYTKEELTGMNNRQYMDKENAKKVFQAFKRVYRTGEPVKELELEVIRKDGTKAFNEISVSLIRDSEGKPTGFRGISRDVTERKRADEALRQSEEKYRTILENIEEGYYEVDLAGNFTFFNGSLCRIFGYPKEELMGMNDRQYTDKESAKRLFQAFNEVYRTGEPHIGYGYEVIRKDGSKRYIEASILLQKDSSDKPIGFRGIIRDITERRRAEEALRESEQRYRNLVENAPDVIFTLAPDGTITSLNPAFETITGWSGAEWLHKQFAPMLHPNDLSGGLELFQHALKGEKTAPFELKVLRKSGDYLVAEFMGTPQTQNGSVIYILGIARDVTERKQMEEALRQSEEKYRTILENIEDGYYEVDLAGNFTFFNDSMCRILGYPKEELMGMNNQQYADKEVARKVFQAFNRVYKAGEPSREFDWEIVRKDGTKRYIETSVSLRKDASDKPVGFRGIVRDVTDRKRIEEQLFQAEKLRAVGEMASGVAHDFNNAWRLSSEIPSSYFIPLKMRS